MGKRTNISASISIELYQWLKNREINISETVEKSLREMKVNDENPMDKVKECDKEIDKWATIREGYLQKLQNVVEEGNRRERDEAKAIQEDIERKETLLIEKHIGLIEELRKNEKWEEFVDNYEEMTTNDIINYNEELNHSGIVTRGWNTLREIMKLFTKEQLKGGVILLKKENVTNVEDKEQN